MYKIELTKRSLKQLEKLDENIKIQYIRLFKELKLNPFLGKLTKTTYHSHVKYHWVAVWEVDQNTKTATVTYVGSREGAPYGR
jgi:mRNA-degrading endonuclease RelE of RelBE toxin-antitoxin system